MITKILSLYMVVGVLFLSIMFVFSLYRGKSGFSKVLALFTFSLDIYLMGYLMELNSDTIGDMLFWNQIQYFGIPFFTVLWLIMTMLYTGRAKSIFERKFALAIIIPIITFFIRLTNEYHHLYYSKIELKEFMGSPMLFLTKGPWYYVQAGFVLICLISCNIFYFQRYVNSSNEEKIQFRLFLVASVLPYIALILIVFNLGNVGIDYTALVFPICVLMINIALTKYNFLEIKLMARERVFEDSNNGLIILNKDLEIKDFNQASTKFFDWMGTPLDQGELETLLKNTPDVVECVKNQKEETFAFIVEGKERFMLATPKEISSKKERVGILLSLEDVTERELMNRKLMKMARFDELSGLYNRRYFVEQAQSAIEQANHSNDDVYVIMIDIDNFKWINDKYGHQCGDRVIQLVSDLLRSTFNGTDIIGRIGGEEFSVVMVNSNLDKVHNIAETYRLKIEQMNYEYNKQKIFVTVSLGIAKSGEHCQSLDELLSCADEALYQSKNNGRNQTTIYK